RISSMNCRVRSISFALLALPLIVACRRTPSEGVTAPARPRSQRTVTCNKDIAPILFDSCATCHRPIDSRPGSTAEADPVCFAGAPFSLLEYAEAQRHAKEIAEATRKRAMPPWLPGPQDSPFANERRLRDD